MSFPDNILTEDEDVILYRNPHWIFMMGSIVMLGLAVLLFLGIMIYASAYWWLGVIAIVFVAIGSLGRFLRWKTTEFVVTSERIITRQGIISKQGMEIPLDRITNVSYSQRVIERILGAGDLVIESAGETGQEPFSNVANPSKVQNIIYRQSEVFQQRRAEGSPPMNDGSGNRHRSHLSVTEQLEKLVALRDKGVLSDEEFENEKRHILG